MSTYKAVFVRKETFCGYKCTVYSVQDYLLYCSDDIGVSPKAAEFIARYIFLPKIEKVPLFRVVSERPRKVTNYFADKKNPWMDQRNLRESKHHAITTQEVKTKVFNPADFEMPKGFQKTKDLRQISFSASKRKDIESLFNDVGFTSDLKF